MRNFNDEHEQDIAWEAYGANPKALRPIDETIEFMTEGSSSSRDELIALIDAELSLLPNIYKVGQLGYIWVELPE